MVSLVLYIETRSPITLSRRARLPAFASTRRSLFFLSGWPKAKFEDGWSTVIFLASWVMIPAAHVTFPIRTPTRVRRSTIDVNARLRVPLVEGTMSLVDTRDSKKECALSPLVGLWRRRRDNLQPWW